MENPYRIEDEKDLVDTRYRRQYRTPIMKKRREAPKIGTSRFLRLQNVYKKSYFI